MHTTPDNLPPPPAGQAPSPAAPTPKPALPMTRRIVAAILLIVWISLLAAGTSTYFITRAILIASLDETIYGRISSLPEIERPSSLPDVETRETADNLDDRYVIQFPASAGPNSGRRIASPTVSPSATPPLRVVSASFGRLAGGTPLRTLTVKAYARRKSPDEFPTEVLVIYSAAADDVDAALTNLLYSFGGFGTLAVVGSLLAARSAARVALAPLKDTSRLIGTIDERSLDRRIDVQKLPAELAPVGTRLNDMLARLETAFLQRRQFLADASHELRTPVAALVTTLEVALRRPREAPDYVRTLESCLADARLLNQLIVALLGQVRSQQFANAPDFAPTPVSTLLAQVANTAETLASQKHISLSRDFPPNLLLLTDELRLRSIVMNLLSNAVEYTPPHGHIWLSAKLLPAPDASPAQLPPALLAALPEGAAPAVKRLLITVSDNGPGIAPQHLPHLFQPFYRADAARTNPEQHLGLGLSIVQTNTLSLGGECRVASPRPDNSPGTEFSIDLPAVDVHPADTFNGASHPSSPAYLPQHMRNYPA